MTTRGSTPDAAPGAGPSAPLGSAVFFAPPGRDGIAALPEGAVFAPGGPAPDTLSGGPLGDLLFGGRGRDRLRGHAGADTLDGDRGADRLDGGRGRDRLAGGAGPDSLSGGPGHDRLGGGPGRDSLAGDGGSDRLRGGRGARDTLDGGDGDDHLHDGGGRGAALFGGAGDDTLRAEGRGALLMPGPGADRLVGAGDASASWADLGAPVRADLRAGRATGAETDDRFSGVSLLIGSAFDDTLKGGARREWEGFVGGRGDDRIDGRGGYDEAVYSLEAAPGGIRADLAEGRVSDGWGATDRLKRVEALTATPHDDTLKGGGSPFESFRGLAGDDRIVGRGGADRIDHSRDADFGGARGVRVDLAAGFARDGFGDRDVLRSIEAVVGTASPDRLSGNARDNRLQGGEGADRLSGGPGRDRLEGGPGRDRLTGGPGPDVFEFARGDGADLIEDFRIGKDRLRLEGLDARGLHELTLRDAGADALLVLGDGDRLRLIGVAAEDLGPGDVWLIAG